MRSNGRAPSVRATWSLFGALLVVACSSSSSSPQDGGNPDGTVPPDGAPDSSADAIVVPFDAPPNDPKCTASFDAGSGHCTVGLTCWYPEGHCDCLGYCGGIAPQPDAGDQSHWQCYPLMTNGCPQVAPAAGSACSPGQSCGYPAPGPQFPSYNCCSQTFTCDGGTWAGQNPICPA